MCSPKFPRDLAQQRVAAKVADEHIRNNSNSILL